MKNAMLAGAMAAALIAAVLCPLRGPVRLWLPRRERR